MRISAQNRTLRSLHPHFVSAKRASNKSQSLGLGWRIIRHIPRLVLTCLYFARIGRSDSLWAVSMNTAHLNFNLNPNVFSQCSPTGQRSRRLSLFSSILGAVHVQSAVAQVLTTFFLVTPSKLGGQHGKKGRTRTLCVILFRPQIFRTVTIETHPYRSPCAPQALSPHLCDEF